MNKKHIDVVVKYFYPIAAGIEVNTMETYSRLVEMGWDVTFHVSNDLYLEKDVLPKYEVIRGIKVKRYKFVSEISGFKPDIDWDKTNIVCLHNFNIFYFKILIKVLYLKIIGGKKFALTITPHGGFNPEWRVFSFFQRIFKPLYHFTIGTFLINNVADGVRAVSIWERDEMIKKGIKRNLISVITNGLEDDAYKDVDKLASIQTKKKISQIGDYIIQVGRIYSIKNYETTIRSLSRVPDDIHYLIVGQEEKDTIYKESLIKLAQDLGVGDRVHFMGVVRGVDKYYMIKHAKMMVHMAMWESFCNVVHEGLSQGLVCIVANNTALPLLVKNNINGFVVETTNDVELSKKINYVLRNYNSPKIVAMRKRNKEVGKDSSWGKVADKMSTLYSNLISKYDK